MSRIRFLNPNKNSVNKQSTIRGKSSVHKSFHIQIDSEIITDHSSPEEVGKNVFQLHSGKQISS